MDAALDEWNDEEITKVDNLGWTPSRIRKPEDGQILKIKLQRPPGGTEVAVIGSDALKDAQSFLDFWAHEKGHNEVAVSVVFGDGLTFSLILNVRRQRDRDLASKLRNLDCFRASFCPDLGEREARAMFEVFLSSYAVGGRVRKNTPSFQETPLTARTKNKSFVSP